MQKKNRKVEKKSDFEKKRKKEKVGKKMQKKKRRNALWITTTLHCVWRNSDSTTPYIYIYIILPICFVIINLYRIILNGQNLPIIYHFFI